MIAAILGLSHLSLSVHDRDASKRFWIEVMGFELASEEEEFCFLLDRGARLAVILTNHAGTVTGVFDEHNVGLDHIAYGVADVESLHGWQQRLTHFGVQHSAITETDAGHHLNLRAPDNLPIELFAMKPEFVRTLGLESEADVVAAGAH
jgi:catechol 2,3-dioxygenase-like lactoylglutathione lyase family enzyme